MDYTDFCNHLCYQTKINLKNLIWEKALRFIHDTSPQIALILGFVNVQDYELIFFSEDVSLIPRDSSGQITQEFSAKVISELFQGVSYE